MNRKIVIAAWIAALSAWVVYERTLRQEPPPPPPPPPAAPEPCLEAHHGGTTEVAEALIADGRRLVWIAGFRTDFPGPYVTPDVHVAATEDRTEVGHRLDFFRMNQNCPRCGGPSWRPLATVDYPNHLIAHGPRSEDLNADNRTELLIPLWNGGWDVFTVRDDAVVRMNPTLDGAYAGLPQDLDGDGVSELVYWDIRDTPHIPRFLVWDGGRYAESAEWYEREMTRIAERPRHDGPLVSQYICYATLLGRAGDAWEVARPWIIAAGLDEHALRDQLEVAFADLTLYRP